MSDKAILLDKRVVERNINKGLITQEEVDAHLNSLPDMEEQSEVLVLDAEDQEAEAEVADALVEEHPEEPKPFNFEPFGSTGPKNTYDF